MASWRNESVDQLCDAILSLRSREECCAFLEDVCTIREIQDLSQRLEVARMILDGTSYSIITRETGASTATISRPLVSVKVMIRSLTRKSLFRI